MTDSGVEEPRKQALPAENDSAPDSWEMIEGLEEKVQKLAIPAASPTPKTEVSNGKVQKVVSKDEKAKAENGLKGSPARTDGIDSFLREALQNPRDRLTILRLEVEVERFLRSSAGSNKPDALLEFAPMTSSYHRLAAHRVAQHHGLATSVADDGTPEARVVCRRTPEMQPPRTRLADVPYEGNKANGDAHAHPLLKDVVNGGGSDAPIKVAIKQRHRGHRKGGMGENGADSGPVPLKTVEQKQEEYNRARARIFSSGESSGSENEGAAARGDAAGGAGSSNNRGGATGIPPRLPPSLSSGDGAAVPDASGQDQAGTASATSPNRDGSGGDGSGAGGSGPSSAQAPGNSSDREGSSHGGSSRSSRERVAIFRDPEKDKQDPDYKRQPRFTPRFDPLPQAPPYGMPVGPLPMPAPYNMAPGVAMVGVPPGMYGGPPMAVAYHAEFPALGSNPQPRPMVAGGVGAMGMYGPATVGPPPMGHMQGGPGMPPAGMAPGSWDPGMMIPIGPMGMGGPGFRPDGMAGNGPAMLPFPQMGGGMGGGWRGEWAALGQGKARACGPGVVMCEMGATGRGLPVALEVWPWAWARRPPTWACMSPRGPLRTCLARGPWVVPTGAAWPRWAMLASRTSSCTHSPCSRSSR
eukprot:jgi/Mesvir1/26242/Mv05720-RA.1